MSVIFWQGPGSDILACMADVALVCPANCVPGVMGKGLAKAFAEFFPRLKLVHHVACQSGALNLDRICKERLCDRNQIPRNVIMLATKDHWRDPSRLSYILSGLGSLAVYLDRNPSIDRVAIPALGCGLGGLPWSSVERLIETMCGLFPDREFYVFPPKESQRIPL